MIGLLTLHAKLLLNVGCLVERLLVAVIPDGNVCASLSECMGDSKSNSGTGCLQS